MAINPKVRKKLEERKKALAEKGGNYDTILLKTGTTRCRALPVAPDVEFGLEVVTFYHDRKTIISPATFSEPCALMDKYNELKDSNDDEDAELVKMLKPRKKYAVLHIKYKDDKGLEIDEALGAKPILLPSGLYNQLIELYLDEEQGDFTDAKNGYDLKYKRSGSTQLDTEYSVVPCKPTRLAKKYDKVYSTEQIIRGMMASYEKTEQILNGIMNGSSSEEDEDEAPRSKKKKTSAGAKESSKSTSSTKSKTKTPSSSAKSKLPSKKKSRGDM